MSKIHKTALGRSFDMSAFAAKHEKTRAVGNMSVNARGDIIDSHNRVINDKNKRVGVMYQNTLKNRVPVPKKTKTIDPSETTKQELADLEDDMPNPDKK